MFHWNSKTLTSGRWRQWLGWYCPNDGDIIDEVDFVAIEFERSVGHKLVWTHKLSVSLSKMICMVEFRDSEKESELKMGNKFCVDGLLEKSKPAHAASVQKRKRASVWCADCGTNVYISQSDADNRQKLLLRDFKKKRIFLVSPCVRSVLSRSQNKVDVEKSCGLAIWERTLWWHVPMSC